MRQRARGRGRLVRVLRLAGLALTAALGSGCTGLPSGVKPVEGFELPRYLGHWYEIARLDHSFERGLTHVSATYTRRKDGGIRVVNRGYDPAAGKWREAVGKAYPIGQAGQGRLKVSFFGPFYSSYNIIALGPDKPASSGAPYRYAMVCGPNRSYLWILARSPRLDAATYGRLIEKARALAFDTDALIRVDQAVGGD